MPKFLSVVEAVGGVVGGVVNDCPVYFFPEDFLYGPTILLNASKFSSVKWARFKGFSASASTVFRFQLWVCGGQEYSSILKMY